jgi:threonine synthase
MGKLSQAVIHGGRLIQVRGNFDDCLEIARELADNYPVHLVNSVNPDRIEGADSLWAKFHRLQASSR